MRLTQVLQEGRIGYFNVLRHDRRRKKGRRRSRMRHRFAFLVAALCGTALLMSAVAAADKPEIDPTYADGQTVYMIGPHLITNARETQPNLYQHAEELYLVVYPIVNGAPVIPTGVTPQCNPCFHPGLPTNLVFHDHVITGLPGQGTDGTAGAYLAPWKIIVLVYNPAYLTGGSFQRVTSAAAVDAGEASGKFLPLFGGSNPFEFETGNVLICPTVSSHA
jgi:hypothetical protein